MSREIKREHFEITNQDEFNRDVARMLDNLYILSIPGMSWEDRQPADVHARDRLAEIQSHAFRDEVAAWNALSEKERDARIQAQLDAVPRAS